MLRNRLVFASVLALCLVAIITVAAIFAQAQPTTPPSPKSSNVIDYGNGGHVGFSYHQECPPTQLTS